MAKTIAAFLFLCVLAASAQPVRIVFDTDMGNDIDDALALAMIHALESRGECKLVAVTLTKDNRWAAPYCDIVNTFYGRGHVPVGVVRNGVTPANSRMIEEPCKRTAADGTPLYARRITSGAEAPEAVELLRRVLAEQPDGSVAMVQVGFSTNFARLIATAEGKQLVARKVRLLSTMAGDFVKPKPEYNIEKDIASAKALFDAWPTPVVFSGWEIGAALKFPARAIETRFAWAANHPVADAYRLYQKFPYDRPTWDLTSVLYAVRPNDGYFKLSPEGRVAIDDKGTTTFAEQAGGRHRYLILDAAAAPRVLEALVELATQPR